MSDPYLADIAIFGFDFAPRGWAKCDGQLLPIQQNQSLYSLLGTTYGGDGRTTFGVPDLRGRVALHTSATHMQGSARGEETHTLDTAEIPSHTHTMSASNADGNAGSPSGALFAGATAALGLSYSNATPSLDTQLASGAIDAAGNDPHNNMMPFQTLNFCIATQGLFPSRN